MNRLTTLVFGLLAFWALFQFGARPQAPVIQQDIQTRVSAALVDAGYSDVVVNVDGRDVTLSGSVSSDDGVKLAGDMAAGVRGVRVVDNALSFIAMYHTRFCKDSSTIVLAGDVSDDDARNAFPERARDMFRYWSVEDDLNVRSDSPEGYRRFMDHALIELGQLDEGCITLDGTSLAVSGSIRSERALTAMKERVGEMDELGFEVSYDLELPTLSDEARACQEEANRRVEPGETVLFDFDSSEVHEDGKQLLDEVVEIAALCPDVDVQVSGHTDAMGDKDDNIDLSKQRADAVVAYLVSAGLDADRLTAVGLGFSQPVADNSTDEGRAQNRRIEFRAIEE